MGAPVVLVVDDTEGNRYAASRVLRGAGMRVVEAATGREALELMRTAPDLVVLDIKLPDMTGYEVARAIKGDHQTSWIPVMHLSASFTANADRAYGLEAGADAYLTHPIDPDVFLATTRALLRVGRAEVKLRQAASEWSKTFDAISEAIFLVDADDVVRRCNRAAAELVDLSPRDVVNRSLGSLLEPTLGGPGAASFRDAVMNAPVRGTEVQAGERWFAVTTDLVPGLTGADGRVVCVVSDIGSRKAGEQERERLLQAAEAARTEAEAANQVKSDFLAIMSHELRTPLNAIGGFVELLALGVRGPVTEAQLADLAKIRRSQVTLTRLISELLSLARLERGAVEYDLEDIVVDEALTRAGELIEQQARERAIEFSCQRCASSIRVRADSDKMQQVLLNLLSNALKFTTGGGRVTLACDVVGDHVNIRVCDTGRGIRADKLDAIFDPFVQVDQRKVRDQQGIGLGLSISRDLARGMGGDLTVESTFGVGSTFTLSLPLAAAS